MEESKETVETRNKRNNNKNLDVVFLFLEMTKVEGIVKIVN
jgi:hypothetical protein